MKIGLKNGALVLLLALVLPSAQAALPNVTIDGKPFPTLALSKTSILLRVERNGGSLFIVIR